MVGNIYIVMESMIQKQINLHLEQVGGDVNKVLTEQLINYALILMHFNQGGYYNFHWCI